MFPLNSPELLKANAELQKYGLKVIIHASRIASSILDDNLCD